MYIDELRSKNDLQLKNNSAFKWTREISETEILISHVREYVSLHQLENIPAHINVMFVWMLSELN